MEFPAASLHRCRRGLRRKRQRLHGERIAQRHLRDRAGGELLEGDRVGGIALRDLGLLADHEDHSLGRVQMFLGHPEHVGLRDGLDARAPRLPVIRMPWHDHH